MSASFIYPTALWLLLLVPLTVGLALLGPRRPTRARFWGGLMLRSLLLTLIILALAGIQLRTPVDQLSAVFVLDVSDSISPDEQARGEDFLQQAIRELPSGDQAAIVVFGKDALVERLASDTRVLSDITSVPISTRTDVASALQLALALLPQEGAKRIVLLSDGRQNIGEALDQAELAAAHRIELTYLPLGAGNAGSEVRLDGLQAPASVRQGQDFEITAGVYSSEPLTAEFRLLEAGALVHTAELALEAGTNQIKIPVTAGESGFRRFSAQVIPARDTHLQNNQASAFTVVHGPPRVLILEGPREAESAYPDPAQAFAQALAAADMQVTVLPAAEAPTNLTAFADYETVILVDVPATSLPLESMEALQVYTRDLGRGLLMTGGEQSFGAGGYLRTPLEEVLPVYMDVNTKEQQANLALVLAVDKSGSMGRCHCDDPDLNQTYTRQETGQPKVDIAKEAVMRAAGALGARDYLGVVAFDDAARWAVETQELVEAYTLQNALGRVPAQGQTNLQAGVEAAYESLQGVDARRKHIILLTDGWVHETALLAQAAEMQAAGITLSVVAAGGGSARYLEELAQSGGGTYYPAEDILKVPEFFLKETVSAAGRYIIEEPFYPIPVAASPVLSDLDTAPLPPLYGYNGTTPKGTARLDLITPQGDPLLATWQHGLGRAAAWTSDVENRWAAQWLAWDDFPQFSAQLVGWLLPAPQVEGLEATAYVQDDRGFIELVAADANGGPRNFLTAQAALVAPDLSVSAVDLDQVAPGVYEVEVPLDQPGTYLVRLGVNEGDHSLGQEILGLVVPYSPEYRETGLDLPFLKEIARITGGGELLEPAAAFMHNLDTVAQAREIWQPLLLVVALLFPLDVAIRRVLLGRADFDKIKNWLGRFLPARAAISQTSKGDSSSLAGLRQARDRVRQRQHRSTHENRPTPPASDAAPSQDHAPSQPEEDASADTLTRLKAAKKRARKSSDNQ